MYSDTIFYIQYIYNKAEMYPAAAALFLFSLLPLAVAESVTVIVSAGVTTTFMLPAWLYPPSGTAGSTTVTVTPTATLVVIPSTTTVLGETTTTVYVGSSTMTMAAGSTASPSPTATTFNSAINSYLSSIMSVETAGAGSASGTSTATLSSTSTATATATVIVGMSPSCHHVFLGTFD